MAETNPPRRKAANFSFIHSNQTVFQFNGLEVVINFAMLDNLGDASQGWTELVAVGMNPATAKSLAYSLMKIIGHYEEVTGTEIALAPELEHTLENAIKAADKLKK